MLGPTLNNSNTDLVELVNFLLADSHPKVHFGGGRIPILGAFLLSGFVDGIRHCGLIVSK